MASFSSEQIVSGQQVVTTSATHLPHHPLRTLLLKAPRHNESSVFFGGAEVTPETGFELSPGESVEADVTNSCLIYVVSTATGQSISWIGCN